MTDIDAFTAKIANNHKRPLNQAYFYAFHSIILAVGYELLGRGYTDERFEIIFDHHAIFGSLSKRWYTFVREMGMDDELRAIAPIAPLFRDDEDTMPLQAADMIAWFFRRDGSGQPHGFRWVQRILQRSLLLSSECQHIDEARVQNQIRLAQEREWTPEMIARARELLGEE